MTDANAETKSTFGTSCKKARGLREVSNVAGIDERNTRADQDVSCVQRNGIT